MEDSQIIALYFQRSQEAISRTALKYGSYCFSIAWNILENREDSEETVNDTYLACWNAIPPHKPHSLSGFVGKITRRIAINRALANSAQKRGGGQLTLALEELEQCIPSRDTPQQILEEKELAAILSCFLRELPDTERKVFLLRYWHLEKLHNIAARFDFSPGKVKSMLHRTRKKLRSCLEKEGISL